MPDMTDEEAIVLEMERQEAATEQDLLDRIANAFDRADKGAEVEAVWPVVEAELALRAEQADASNKRIRAVAVEILGKFHQQVIFGEYSSRTGWIPEKQIAAWRGALDQPTGQDHNKPDWRERARARVGDRVDARMTELMAEPPMSADEFDEAMRRNKAEAEAYLNRQSHEAFGDRPTDTTGETETPDA